MSRSKLTKIIATLGPSSDSPAKIKELIESGVNIFRFNTKHADLAWHQTRINLVQKIADQMGATIGILLDLQGPEIRLETRDAQPVTVRAQEKVKVGHSFADGVNIIIPHPEVFKLVKKGQEVLIDDGAVEAVIVNTSGDGFVIELKDDSVIGNRKGLNLPGIELDFPALIERDIQQLEGNAKNKIDFVGLSFVRSARDIELLKNELGKRKIEAKIVAKIESQPALDRIDEIIKATDAVMVARGDLGIEVPIERLAYWQRIIIAKCRAACKPVITATQMLESMIQNPRPTRAEATDVAHAIYDGTDAVMLSGETASGKYPVRAVQIMEKIASFNEPFLSLDTLPVKEEDQTHTLADSAVNLVKTSHVPKINAVVVFTETGHTARAVARHHLTVPVIAATDRQKTCETLTLSFGVTPILTKFPKGEFTNSQIVLKDLLRAGCLKHGDTVVVVHGHFWQKPGNTNALAIVAV